MEQDADARDAKAAGGCPPDLCDALRDLDQAKDEAREEEFPVPAGKALGNARRLLHAMHRISPRRFEVYPTPDGEIAIDAPGGPGRSVLLLCDSDGGALCLVNMNGAHRRARYSDTRKLPDGLVREALSELEQQRDTFLGCATVSGHIGGRKGKKRASIEEVDRQSRT